jgi:SAM-dependent methyltransferase
MTEIANTGERILLEKESPLMIARHFCAYQFAKDYMPGKDALDIGCGEGYGSYYLSGFAKSVRGIDYDNAIIDYARNKYRRDNLAFQTVNIKDLGSMERKFDAICSFQVIEHINDAKMYLKDIAGLLSQNQATFICSTPNRLDASPGSVEPYNKFHVREYLLDEFAQLLKGYFKEVKIFGLKRGGELRFYRRLKKSGIFNFLPDKLNPVKRFYQRIDCDNFIIVEKNLETALDFIAVCS